MAEAAERVSYPRYLERERESGERLEYVDGFVYAMAGGTPTHSRLCTNVVSLLREALAGQRCVAHGTELKLRVEATNRTTYADASVFCDTLALSELDPNAATNPKLIVEVLSPSTEASDRGEKFAHYQRLASLEEYVLVNQDRARVEVFTRSPDGDGKVWRMTIFGPGERVTLSSLDVELAVDDIYHDPLA